MKPATLPLSLASYVRLQFLYSNVEHGNPSNKLKTSSAFETWWQSWLHLGGTEGNSLKPSNNRSRDCPYCPTSTTQIHTGLRQLRNKYIQSTILLPWNSCVTVASSFCGLKEHNWKSLGLSFEGAVYCYSKQYDSVREVKTASLKAEWNALAKPKHLGNSPKWYDYSPRGRKRNNVLISNKC